MQANRAGFVFFAMAIAIAKVQLTPGVAAKLVGRYCLLYAALLLLALLFWSTAFLHRQRTLKAIGAVGVLASIVPIIALVVGGRLLGVGDDLMAAFPGTP